MRISDWSSDVCSSDCPDDNHSLSEFLRGRALFASGLGVEEINAREAAGWTFRKTRISEQFDFSAAKAVLPEGADLLLLLRKNGTLRFFTHASRPTPERSEEHTSEIQSLLRISYAVF